jgi:hypothetical protein
MTKPADLSTWPTLALLALLLVYRPCLGQQPEKIETGRFSAGAPGGPLPAGWQPLTFHKIERHTDYSLVEDDGRVVLRADSDSAAAGLVHALDIDPAQYPVIEWRWKVGNTLRGGNMTRRDGDDYPARVYVSFAFDPERASLLERIKQQAARLIWGEDIPYRAVSYIWASNSPAGSMAANPYTDRTMMFALRSGEAGARQWVSERRNVVEDYRKAFGEAPTRISGVGIMTDTDNTGETATAWYGDIVFLKQ